MKKDITEKELIKNFTSTVLSKDEPIADISSSNYFELLKFTKKKSFELLFLVMEAMNYFGVMIGKQ